MLKKEIIINGKRIGENSPTFLIAEVGVNHNGDLEIAKKLIDLAVDAQIDAVKFQTFKAENLILKSTPKVEYQKSSDDDTENFYDLLKKYELTLEDFKSLKEYCSEKGIIFLSTPFENLSVELLESLNVPAFKIGSGDMNNYLLLKLVCSKKKPILLSTGMANLEEVKKSVDFIEKNGVQDIIIFQCTTNYPAPYQTLNLNVIDTFKKEFPNKIIGFSDHSTGIEASIAAIAKGVKVIEKHFTLDKNMEGPDHKASMDPAELLEWIKSIRNTEEALGNKIKTPDETEIKIAEIARKSIISAIDLEKGDVINENNITVKRPGTGIPPSEYYKILGRKVKSIFIPEDSVISWEDLEK